MSANNGKAGKKKGAEASRHKRGVLELTEVGALPNGARVVDAAGSYKHSCTTERRLLLSNSDPLGLDRAQQCRPYSESACDGVPLPLRRSQDGNAAGPSCSDYQTG